jgi:hypothetical protein
MAVVVLLLMYVARAESGTDRLSVSNYLFPVVLNACFSSIAIQHSWRRIPTAQQDGVDMGM